MEDYPSYDALNSNTFALGPLNSTSYNDSNPDLGIPNYIEYLCQDDPYIDLDTYLQTCTPAWNIINKLKLFCLPIFVVVGSIGNTLAFCVLTRKAVTQTSMTFYMASLMIIHTVILYMGCGLEWYSYITEKAHIAFVADWSCKLFYFAFPVFRYSAGWIMVAMTTNCFLEIWCPRSASCKCTLFSAKFVTISVFVWLVTIHIHTLWTYELTGHGTCNLAKYRHDFETEVWPWISAVFSNYLPVLFVLFNLLALIIGLAFKSEERQVQSNQNECFIRLSIFMAVLYLLHTMPAIVMNFIDLSQPQWQSSQDHEDWQLYAKYIIIQVVFSTMEGFYLSICFLLMLLFVPVMRSELKKMFCLSSTCSTPAQIEEETRVTGHLLSSEESKYDVATTTVV